MGLSALITRLFASEPDLRPSDLPDSRMDRRAFLRVLGATAAGVALAPIAEQLLWVPRAQIVVPPMVAPGGQYIYTDWLTREALRVLESQIVTFKALNRSYARTYEDVFYGDIVRVTDRRRVA